MNAEGAIKVSCGQGFRGSFTLCTVDLILETVTTKAVHIFNYDASNVASQDRARRFKERSCA